MPETNGKRWLIIAIALPAIAMVVAPLLRGKTEAVSDVAPTKAVAVSQDKGDADDGDSVPKVRDSSIEEVLTLATSALEAMGTSLSDYTARFIKQERDAKGVLGEQNEIQLKVQSRMRNETNDAPVRVYLRFVKPDSLAGREVIWGGDLYDGQMAVHETSLLLSWKTIWLDPTGMIAMNGQRFPIYEIGLVKLVEQLIERGEPDRGNPDISVTITRDHEFDSRMCELIRVTRAKPSGEEGDFSLAEIVFDPEELIILSYRSFGWSEGGEGEPPLLESYEYRELKTNVGLTDTDFDVANPDYSYPE